MNERLDVDLAISAGYSLAHRRRTTDHPGEVLAEPYTARVTEIKAAMAELGAGDYISIGDDDTISIRRKP